ncbi:MAG: hypothetical protein WCI60_01640 [bacterium]
MTTRLSQFNNTGTALQLGGTFTGLWERTLTNLELTVFVNCSGLSLLTIQQSVDASNVRIPETFNYVPSSTVETFSASIGLPFFRVILRNMDVGPQAYLTLNTYLISTPPLQVQVEAGDVVVSGTVSIAGKVDVSGNTFSNGNLKTLDSGVYKPTNDGISTQFEKTASAVNNAAVYYQDETKGVDVAGGWQFTSVLAPGGTKNTKINWYMYQPTTDVVITDLSNNPINTYYTIVDNVGVEFPMIYIYTKPTTPATKTTGGTAGSSWYQSKFVYQANQVGSVGTYLLYAGKNPTTIRPDLTHINLRQLDSLCLGTLQSNEIVMSASLQTSSNLASPAGNFSITMSKFGVVIVPVDTALSVDATGALAVKIASVAVTGTFWQTTQPVSVAQDLSCNVSNFPASQAVTGAFYPAVQDVSGSVSILNSFHLNTWTYADISGSWVSDSADLRYYSLADIYMLSAGSVTSVGGMVFNTQYSPDNINWFNSGPTLSLSSTALQGIAVGKLSASPYVRLVADSGNLPMDFATNVKLWIPSKAI